MLAVPVHTGMSCECHAALKAAWPAAELCADLLAAFSGCWTWPTYEDSALSAAVSPFSLGLLSPSALLIH